MVLNLSFCTEPQRHPVVEYEKVIQLSNWCRTSPRKMSLIVETESTYLSTSEENVTGFGGFGENICSEQLMKSFF